MHDGRTRLNAGDRASIGERHVEIDLKRVHAERLLRASEERAHAIALLHRTLHEAEEKTTKQIMKPLEAKITSYLEEILPGSQVALDEDLRISHLLRDGKHVSHENLSMGTREQLGVLIRLAFAEILHEDGLDSPLFLDDVLVYSDDARFSAMKRLIQKLAARHQIVVLTCRPKDWNDVEARRIRLEECIQEAEEHASLVQVRSLSR